LKPGSSYFWGITVSIVVFFVLLIGLVLYTTTLDYGLVADDYYERGLDYQQQIDRLERTQALKGRVKINYEVRTGIAITFPDSVFDPAGITGVIELYRPSDSSLDMSYPIEVDRQGIQLIAADSLKTGLWRVKVSWMADGMDYYTEQSIFIKNQQ